MNIIFGIMSQYDTTFDLKINVGHYISWSSDFVIYLEGYLMYEHHTLGLCQYDPTFDLKIHVGHCDLYFMFSDFA